MAGKIFSKDFLQAWTVGLNMVLATFVGLGIGYWLDSIFDTSPWLTLIFLFLGIIAGFRELFKMARKQDNESDKKDI
ncbi:MAG: AtpZ/AtpI family protein [Nitrospirota bacterium]